MTPIRSYRDLLVWQRGVELCIAVYRTTAQFPQDERFGLVAQTRRCAVSIPSNIAEGFGRGSRDDYRRFVRIARGSINELETQLHIASQLGFLEQGPAESLLALSDETARMIAGLLKSLTA